MRYTLKLSLLTTYQKKQLNIKYFNNMEFYIKQNTDLPILKMEFVDDGKTDSFKRLNNEIINAKIRFSMLDLKTNQKIIFMENAYLTDKIKSEPESENQYYIFYKWKLKDTRKKGRFLGEFSISTSSGELIAPIRENLYINII